VFYDTNLLDQERKRTSTAASEYTLTSDSLHSCTGWGKITSLNFKVNKKKLFEIQKFYFWILKLQHGKF
jgi:hypothetical protein